MNVRLIAANELVETLDPQSDIAPPNGSANAGWKRGFDCALAAVLLILTSPLLLLAAVLVKLTSRGPVFYSQLRLGRDRRPFWIYKIRSMTHNCERDSGAVWSSRNDPRVFPLGRVLRKLHIDELPQLINVLRGDMAMIGPRPERPTIEYDLSQDIPGFADRLAVRPGLSGLAQVQFPPDTSLGSVCRKLLADLQYIRSAGPWLDFRIACHRVLSAPPSDVVAPPPARSRCRSASR